MSEPKAHNIADIEGLLASRQQIMGWLDRLDSTASTRAPESVRAKVRSDYKARLAQVVSQLTTHSDTITSALDGLRAQAREVRHSRGEELEIRAEAELRHGVGEYSDDEWQLVELESSGKIAEFDSELERLSGEIGKLDEVLALITPGSKPQAPEPQPDHDLHVTHGTDMPPMLDREPISVPVEPPPLALVRDEAPPPAPMPRPEAPRFTPRAGVPRPSGPVKTMPMPKVAESQAPAAPKDELAFLRSVSIEASQPAARTAPPPLVTGHAAEREGSGQTMAKTLKCSECGSLNRPTEWYCERCGAELAAL